MAILEDKKKPYSIYGTGTPTAKAQDKMNQAAGAVVKPIVDATRNLSGALGGNAIQTGINKLSADSQKNQQALDRIKGEKFVRGSISANENLAQPDRTPYVMAKKQISGMAPLAQNKLSNQVSPQPLVGKAAPLGSSGMFTSARGPGYSMSVNLSPEDRQVRQNMAAIKAKIDGGANLTPEQAARYNALRQKAGFLLGGTDRKPVGRDGLPIGMGRVLSSRDSVTMDEKGRPVINMAERTLAEKYPGIDPDIAARYDRLHQKQYMQRRTGGGFAPINEQPSGRYFGPAKLPQEEKEVDYSKITDPAQRRFYRDQANRKIEQERNRINEQGNIINRELGIDRNRIAAQGNDITRELGVDRNMIDAANVSGENAFRAEQTKGLQMGNEEAARLAALRDQYLAEKDPAKQTAIGNKLKVLIGKSDEKGQWIDYEEPITEIDNDTGKTIYTGEVRKTQAFQDSSGKVHKLEDMFAEQGPSTPEMSIIESNPRYKEAYAAATPEKQAEIIRKLRERLAIK